MAKEKAKRFETTYIEQSLTEQKCVVVDKETGVNYLWYNGSLGGGITPLFDENGHIIVTKKDNN